MSGDEFDIEIDDAEYFLECEYLKIAIRELLRGEVKEGDESLTVKARKVLEFGSKHLREKRPSQEFLDFIQMSISNTLNGSEKSLDYAFRLKAFGRPKEDPYCDPEVIEYLRLHEEFFYAPSYEGESLKEREKRIEVFKLNAIASAYKIKHGKTPDEHIADGILSDTVKKRTDKIKKKLIVLGYY